MRRRIENHTTRSIDRTKWQLRCSWPRFASVLRSLSLGSMGICLVAFLLSTFREGQRKKAVSPQRKKAVSLHVNGERTARKEKQKTKKKERKMAPAQNDVNIGPPAVTSKHLKKRRRKGAFLGRACAVKMASFHAIFTAESCQFARILCEVLNLFYFWKNRCAQRNL